MPLKDSDGKDACRKHLVCKVKERAACDLQFISGQEMTALIMDEH